MTWAFCAVQKSVEEKSSYGMPSRMAASFKAAKIVNKILLIYY